MSNFEVLFSFFGIPSISCLQGSSETGKAVQKEMLTEEQIREEAEKRIAAMDHRERRALEVEIRDGIYLADNVSKFGYKVLSKEERLRYHRYNDKILKTPDSESGLSFKRFFRDLKKGVIPLILLLLVPSPGRNAPEQGRIRPRLH